MAASYRREETTTTVVRLRIQTPAHWNDVAQVWWHARAELMRSQGLPEDTTPADDAIWYEPGDDDIAVCFEKTLRHENKVAVVDRPESFGADINAAALRVGGESGDQ